MPQVPPSMSSRRRPSELYAVGRPIIVDDLGIEEVPKLGPDRKPLRDEAGAILYEEVDLPPFTAWVQKLSDIEISDALQYTQRGQAIAMAPYHDPDSDESQAVRAEIGTMARADLVLILTEREVNTKRQAVEARVIGEMVVDHTGEEVPGKWGKDDYIYSLRDAWESELKLEYALDEDHPEANRVLDEINTFNELVDAELDPARDIERAVYESWTEDALRDHLFNVMVEMTVTAVANDRYDLACLWLATRVCEGPDPEDPKRCLCRGSGRKHTKKSFDGIDEVRSTDGRVRSAIGAAYRKVVIDSLQGKGSRATRSSSTQSGPPADSEGSASSSPTASNP